ncbi:MAG: AAA family ATPase [Rikenellaceae bacterium]|jgi:exodeoxyribonuclease-5|nr:AAA family ATPase [Rikenellaceae bacterium]
MHGIHNIATQIYAKFAFTPTFGQKKIIEKLSEWVESGDSERIFILNGYAGTGKTTLLGALVEVLRDNAIRPVLLAPTGRAAKVLAQYTGEKTYTIHKKIYRQQTSAAIESKFSLDYNRERGAIFIIDEASMLANGSSYEDSLFGSGALLEDLVKYVRSGRDCRLMLVGDSAQLPPVGNDYSPALDPVYMSAFGSVDYGSLDDVVRQDIDSGILFNATLVRTMLENRIFDIPLLDMSYPDVESIDGGEFMEKIEECYSKWGRDETIVITRSNKRANRFNEALRRRVLYAEEEIESGDMLMVVKNNYYYASEDENDKEAGGMNFIANGDIARLRRLRRFEELYGFRFANAVLEFDDAEQTEVECKILLDTIASESPSLTRDENLRLFRAIEEDYPEIRSKAKRYKEIRENAYFNAVQVKFAYAVTCHKSQGGQWSAVFIDRMLFGDETMSRDLLRWLYTAMTRATQKLYFVNFDERFFDK